MQGAEGELPLLLEGEDDLSVEIARAARGTFTVWTNGYFTLQDNTQWKDVKVRVLPRWHAPEHMGLLSRSKTVVPAHFAEGRENPWRAYAVCRSWSIWRARQGNFLAHSSRSRVFQNEMRLLREELAAMGHGGRTGNAYADTLIEGWTPEVFR